MIWQLLFFQEKGQKIWARKEMKAVDVCLFHKSQKNVFNQKTSVDLCESCVNTLRYNQCVWFVFGPIILSRWTRFMPCHAEPNILSRWIKFMPCHAGSNILSHWVKFMPCHTGPNILSRWTKFMPCHTEPNHLVTLNQIYVLLH
jgi:hypothetical protein